MLILVAVTVTVAKDGGLFETARTAKTGTQKEADRENLVAAAVGAYDARSQEVKEEELKQNLGNEWSVENQTNYYKVTSPNGNEFKVNIKNATVEDNKVVKDDKQQEDINIGPDATVALSEDGVLTVSGTGSIWTGNYYNEDGNIIYPIMMKKFNKNENAAILAMLFVSGAESYNDIKSNIGSSLDEKTITQIESLTKINKIVVEKGITEIGCSSFLGFGDNVILLQLPETITKIEEGALDKAKIKKILILLKSLEGVSIEDSDISSSYNQGTDENGNIIFTRI